ncbi:hypothetical protein HPB50_026041 [Hyalomma asiaticum]|uniref:Uncharacterized protein n=1 Tax=Hyalomma asiaticum TaxID=266040 RepID=A0ACB7STG7_HYAAI|nr:hypothetical protein HPB50_026041 [Hyalomma asiaticum]
MPGTARAQLQPRAPRWTPTRVGYTWQSRPAQHRLCRAEMLLNTAALTAVRNQRPTSEPRTPLGTARHHSAASGPNTGTWDPGTSATLDLAWLCGPLYLGTHKVSPGRSSRSSRSLGLHSAWPEFCERASCHHPLLSRFSALGAAVPTTWPRRLGLPCNTDAECLASLGLSCQFWVCECAPQTPVKVESRGELRCVPARSLYQPCRFHQECNHTSSPMRCVESLCLCPAPFEPTRKGGCAAREYLTHGPWDHLLIYQLQAARPSLQARLTRLVDAATPATAALVIAALLMAAFFFVRMLPRSKSRSGSTSSDELCSAQAPLQRKHHSAYPSAMEIPRHLRGLPLRQNAPQRALPIRRIRMPPAMEAGTPASAGPSAVAIASSAESMMVETSTGLSPPASVHSKETKRDESSIPGSVSSKAVSSSSDDVADVHGTNKGSTTSLAGMGLLAAPARLLPCRSATSTLSLSIKWGANKSSTSSSTNNKVAVPKKSLKSAIVPGKAAVPDDDDSEVPSGLTCYRRQKSVAFVETMPKGDEPSSPTEASEDKDQGCTPAGARSPGVQHRAMFSPQHSTTEASEEVTVTPDKACPAPAPSSASDAETSENVDTLGDDVAVSALTEASTVLTPASSDDRAIPDLALESGHCTEARWVSGTSTGWNATDYSEPSVCSAADAGSGTPGALPPIPLKRRRFQLGTTTMSEKAHGQEEGHIALANTPENVKPPYDTTRDTAVEEVDAGAYHTGVLKEDLRSKSMEGTSCNTGPGLSVTGLTEMIPSIKRALPIRRIRMPPAMEAGTPASAGPSAVAIASSAESVMVETSTGLSPPASVHSKETKGDESSIPGSVSSKAVSSSSDDVADVHGTNKGSTTSLAGIGLLAAPARLLPCRSATSTLSLSIKWGANKSSTSSSTNNKVAVPKKSLKSAIVPGKAAVPDDDDSEVPSGLTCYRRQKSVAFVETMPKGGEPSSPTEASEDKEQSCTPAGARSPGVRHRAMFSPQHSTTEASEEVTCYPRQSLPRTCTFIG